MWIHGRGHFSGGSICHLSQSPPLPQHMKFPASTRLLPIEYGVRYQRMQGLPKKMYDFQRQHPIAAVSRAITMIRANLVTILVFLFIGAQSESFSFFVMIGGGFALLMISGFLD